MNFLKRLAGGKQIFNQYQTLPQSSLAWNIHYFYTAGAAENFQRKRGCQNRQPLSFK